MDMMKYARTLSASARKKLGVHLKRGGLVAYPTESCYGIGCLPGNTVALKQLVRLKKRPQNKGMIVIGSSLKQLMPLLERPSENTPGGIFPAFRMNCKDRCQHCKKAQKHRNRCYNEPDLRVKILPH